MFFLYIFFVIFLANFQKYISMQSLIKIYGVVQMIMIIFTQKPQLVKMMLSKASSPFCIPVAGQC